MSATAANDRPARFNQLLPTAKESRRRRRGGGAQEVDPEEVELDGRRRRRRQRRWQERGGPVEVSKRHVSANVCGTISANVRRPGNFLFFRRTEHSADKSISTRARNAVAAVVPRFLLHCNQPTDRPTDLAWGH